MTKDKDGNQDKRLKKAIALLTELRSLDFIEATDRLAEELPMEINDEDIEKYLLEIKVGISPWRVGFIEGVRWALDRMGVGK